MGWSAAVTRTAEQFTNPTWSSVWKSFESIVWSAAGLFSSPTLVATLVSKGAAIQTNDCGDVHLHHIIFSTARSHSQPVVSEKLPNYKGKIFSKARGCLWEVATGSCTDTANPHLHFIQSTLFVSAVPCVANRLARGAGSWLQEAAVQEVDVECAGNGYSCLSSLWGRREKSQHKWHFASTCITVLAASSILGLENSG